MRNLETKIAIVVAASLGLMVSAEARSCFSGKETVSPDQVKADEAAITANPGSWFAGKGGGLTKAVRDLAAADPAFAATIVSSHKGAGGGQSKEQAAAIGAGLGQASLSCKDFTDEAGKIQTAASSSSEDALVASFNTTIGSAQTGAVGGGGGGDGSGIGGPSTTTSSNSGGSGSRTDTNGSTGTTNRFVSLLTSLPGTSVSAASSSRTVTAAQAVSINP